MNTCIKRLHTFANVLTIIALVYLTARAFIPFALEILQ